AGCCISRFICVMLQLSWVAGAGVFGSPGASQAGASEDSSPGHPIRPSPAMADAYFASLLTLLLVPLRSAAEPPLSLFSFTEPHRGTGLKIILYAPEGAGANKAARAAFARIAELEGIMSDYRPASELMELCKKAGEGPVKVSNDLFYVL